MGETFGQVGVELLATFFPQVAHAISYGAHQRIFNGLSILHPG